jgi:hypothetical protein
MGEAKHHEGGLERELDDLYRKVAGLNPSENRQDREEPKNERIVCPPAGTTPPRKRKPVRGRRRRRVAAVAWTFAATLLVSGAIALLYPLVGYRHGTLTVGGIDYPSKTHRLTGETSYSSENQWLQPPDTPGEAYAIQLRAYPEGQKVNAVAFLEELRKREPDASLETVRITGRGVWHRILVGHFPTAEKAADYQKSHGLASDYPYSFIQELSRGRPQAADVR